MGIVAFVLGVVLIATVFSSVRVEGTPSSIARGASDPLPPEPDVYDTSIYECLNNIAADVDGASPEGERVTRASVATGVEDVRDLKFKHRVKTKLLTEKELSDKLGKGIDPPKSAIVAGKVMEELTLIPRGSDISKLAKTVATTQIAAFYLPSKKKIYSPRSGKTLSAYNEIMLSHETQHALADQILGLPKRPKDPRRSDEAAAATALIEGDAQLTSGVYARMRMSPERLGELAETATAETEEATSVDIPPFIRKSMEFSYNEGALFACHLYERGGWDAIDKAYRKPPRSTLEVLFPQRYGNSSFKPIDPPDPRNPKGWQKAGEYGFGAAELMFMLATSETDTSPVWGWRGGEVTSWTKGRRVAVALTLVDKPPNDAPGYVPLCVHLEDWVNRGYIPQGSRPIRHDIRNGALFDAGDRTIVVQCEGDLVRLSIAPGKGTAIEAARLQDTKAHGRDGSS